MATGDTTAEWGAVEGGHRPQPFTNVAAAAEAAASCTGTATANTAVTANAVARAALTAPSA